MSDVPRSRRRARAWPLRVRSTVLLAAACAATGVAGALALHPPGTRRGQAVRPATVSAGGLRGDAAWAPGARPAPPFALRDQWNRRVSLSGQHGRAVLLAFMDAECTFICTLEGPALSDVQRRVGAGARLALLVVSVDPWQDTAASSRAIAARWGFGGDWHWLRGSLAQLQPIWRAYGIEVARTAGDVSHSTAVYLIDRRGYERGGFNYPFAEGQVAHDLRLLAPRQAT